jgi:hypothetical protein
MALDSADIAAIAKIFEGSISNLNTRFDNHILRDDENQKIIIRLISESENIQKMNAELQKIIKDMPKDMYRRFEEIAEKRFKAVEKMADLANKSAQERIDACQDGAPDRNFKIITDEIGKRFKEFKDDLPKIFPVKRTAKDLILYASLILLLGGSILAGGMTYLTSQKDVVRLEKKIEMLEVKK